MNQIGEEQASPDMDVLGTLIKAYLSDHSRSVAFRCLSQGQYDLVKRMIVEAVTAEFNAGRVDASLMDRVLSILNFNPSKVVQTVGTKRCYVLRGH